MTRKHGKRPQFWRKKWRSLYLWHRYIGLAAAAFVVILSITGLMLNHTGRLGLSSQHASSDWILDWYGIAPEGPFVTYPLGRDRWLASVDNRLFLGGKPLGDSAGNLVGAVATDDLVAVAAPSAITLYTIEGELVEQLNSAALPGRINAIGVNAGGGLALKTPKGIFHSDPFVTAWTPGPSAPKWAGRETPPDHIRQEILGAYRGTGLSWERIILDLHSGRIMGDWGLYVMDASALILLLLSATGFYNWIKSKRRKR